MLKRVGVLALVLTAGALLPAGAFAAERTFGHNAAPEHRNNVRVVQEYREPVRHDDRDRNQWTRGSDRVIVRTAPTYYYRWSPYCR